jgi:hypothetical protein
MDMVWWTFETPKQMRSMAETSFDQARKATKKSSPMRRRQQGSREERDATVRTGAKDVGARAIRPHRTERAALAGLRAFAATRLGRAKSCACTANTFNPKCGH